MQLQSKYYNMEKQYGESDPARLLPLYVADYDGGRCRKASSYAGPAPTAFNSVHRVDCSKPATDLPQAIAS